MGDYSFIPADNVVAYFQKEASTPAYSKAVYAWQGMTGCGVAYGLVAEDGRPGLVTVDEYARNHQVKFIHYEREG